MDKRSNLGRRTRLRKVIEGIAKRLGDRSSILIHGVSLTPAKLAQVFQDELDAMEVVRRAAAAHADGVVAQKLAYKRARPFDLALESLVRATFGNDMVALGAFGYSGGKKGKKNVAVKVGAAIKAVATRQARQTMGKKQKKKFLAKG